MPSIKNNQEIDQKLNIRSRYRWDPPGWLLIVGAWIFETIGVSTIAAYFAQYPATSDVIATFSILSVWLVSLAFMTYGAYLAMRFMNNTARRIYFTIFAAVVQGIASFLLMMILSVVVYFASGGSC
jgi:hypothetical protein